MRVTRVTMGTSRHYLALDVDVAALKEEIVRACRAEGAFVDLRLASEQVISMLVTVGSTVFFETMDASEEDIEHDDLPDSGRLVIDGDYWIE